jgi:hypothetical protein
LEACGLREIATIRTEIPAGGKGRVKDIAGIGFAVAIAVGTPVRPGARDELHRADRPIIDFVPIKESTIGIADNRIAGNTTIEPRSKDAAACPTVREDSSGLSMP